MRPSSSRQTNPNNKAPQGPRRPRLSSFRCNCQIATRKASAPPVWIPTATAGARRPARIAAQTQIPQPSRKLETTETALPPLPSREERFSRSSRSPDAALAATAPPPSVALIYGPGFSLSNCFCKTVAFRKAPAAQPGDNWFARAAATTSPPHNSHGFGREAPAGALRGRGGADTKGIRLKARTASERPDQK